MMRAYTFPGQGSQSVGMGKALYDEFVEARHVFEEVDDALSEKLSAVIFDGPEDALKLTANTQPALMAVSIAAVKSMETRGVPMETAAYVAGHSLGEYTALCAVGTLSITDTARLLRLRGQSMQAAVAPGEGAMAALIGASIDQAEEIATKASRGAVCEVANDNAPGQVVLSGAADAIDRAVDLAKEAGIKRAVLLPVSAPFHCSLMKPAADVMASAFEDVTFVEPLCPVVTNVKVAPTRAPADIKAALIEQVTGRVRWTECVKAMAEHGVTHLVEIGAGKVLTGLAKRIDKSLTSMAFNAPSDLDALVELANTKSP